LTLPSSIVTDGRYCLGWWQEILAEISVCLLAKRGSSLSDAISLFSRKGAEKCVRKMWESGIGERL
jgi:hypothetical protein